MALIVSIVGWIRDSNRAASIAGTLISAVELLGFFGLTFLSLCR
jgi:hypothetical protein